MVKIDLRTVTMEVPPQEIITRDNVPARVTAVIYFRVVDPNKSVLEVEDHVLATWPRSKPSGEGTSLEPRRQFDDSRADNPRYSATRIVRTMCEIRPIYGQ